MVATKICNCCNKNIGKNKLKLQCGYCQQYFHIECGKISELEARIMMSEKKSWKCECCESNTSSRFTSSPRRNHLDEIELKTMIKMLQNDVQDLKKSMDFISEKYEEEKKRNAVISDMLSELSRDNDLLKKEVNNLKYVLNINESNKIKNNLRISGINLNTENPKVVFEAASKVFTFLGVDVPREEITNIKMYKGTKGSSAIISLKSLDKKQQLLNARANKGKIKASSCGLGNDEALIFLDEELTKETYNLYKKAKCLKEHGYKYIWHKDGKVFVRRMDGDNVIVIKNELVLNDLLN